MAKDENGKQYMVPIKEQCGVRNPYVREYGALRNFTDEDACACKGEEKVTGIWVTMEIISQEFTRTMENLFNRQAKIIKNAIEDRVNTVLFLPL